MVSFTTIFAQDGDFVALKTIKPITIDGIANDSIWNKQEWNSLDYVWIPYNTAVSAEDFTGRFKLAWDSSFLYLLVEAIDDSLYDGHAVPTDNYWNDDCVEVFLDEDHSGGIHQNSFNAFAYHVSTLSDVVDFGISSTDTFNSHINVKWLKNDNTYTWELAIKIFDDSFIHNKDVPVKLTKGKVMGFSLAYCDNDGSPERENFIGSKFQTEANSNRSYIDASIFGSVTLVDSSGSEPDTTENPDAIQNVKNGNKLFVYPSVCKKNIYLTTNSSNYSSELNITILDLKGITYYSERQFLAGEKTINISISDFPVGLYNVLVQSDQGTSQTRFLKIE